MNIILYTKGSALLTTLVMLTVMLISSIAVINSTQSITNISGNMAFKESASWAGDVAIFQSINTLTRLGNKERSIDNQYYATQLELDSNGIPTTIVWDDISTNQVQQNTVRYVIERLCKGDLPVTDYEQQCNTGLSPVATSKKMGAQDFQLTSLYYRVTIRIDGAKNTTSYVQAIVMQE